MSWKLGADFKRRPPPKKLEEQSPAKLQGCQEKTRGKEKRKLI